MQASVRLDHTVIAVEREHDVHAMLEISVPAGPDEEKRPPLALALVVDRSGSMAGAKLAVAKRCARWLVERLRPQDELALVAYDDKVRLLSPLEPVQPARLAAAIASLGPGGQTNLSGGWLRGLEQLRAAPAHGTRAVLLLTDGLANEGVTDAGSLVEMTRKARADGVSTTTIGFGEGFDEDLLTAMADGGGGNPHYAETPDAAPAIFAAELEGLSSVAAQNVSVEIRPAPHVEVLGMPNEYPALEVPGGIQVELGDAYGGERRRVVLAFHIPFVAALGPVQVAELVLRYTTVGDEIAQHSLSIPVIANCVSAEEAETVAPDPEVREEILVLRAARARDEAIELADSGRHFDAQTLMLRMVGDLRESGLDEEADLLDEAAPKLAPEAYGPTVRKNLNYESWQTRRNRRP